MFKKKAHLLVLSAALMALLFAACTMATPTPPFGIDFDPGAATIPPGFDPGILIGTPFRSTCGASGYAEPTFPVTPEVLSTVLTPNALISWTYPEFCNPVSWDLQIAEDRDFTVNLADHSVPGEHRSLIVPVDPGKQYYWRVGPSDGSPTEFFSRTFWFFTGPVCEEAELARPDLLMPFNFTTIATLTPILSYTSDNYDTCTPEEFWIDLNTDSSFATGSPWFQTGAPAWAVAPSEPLMDCTEYHWRVAAMKDGTRGPFSETFNFYVNASGTCVRERTAAALVLDDALCLEGPHPSFDPVSAIEAQTRVDLLGIGESGQWFPIDNPDFPDITCWLNEEDLDLGDLDIRDLQVFDEPLPPVVPPPDDGNSGQPPSGPPAAPSNFGVQSKGCDQTIYVITLGWNDNANNEQGFRLYRQAANQNSPQLLATLGPNATSYTDQVTDGQTYTYFIESFNATGASSRVQVSVPTTQCLI